MSAAGKCAADRFRRGPVPRGEPRSVEGDPPAFGCQPGVQVVRQVRFQHYECEVVAQPREAALRTTLVE